MPRVPIHAQPPLEFVAPCLSTGVVRAIGTVLPSFIKWRTSIERIEAANPERLVRLYKEFQDGGARFLIAFRHSRLQDPLPLWYLLSHIVPKSARDSGVMLREPNHVYFLYDRGVPLWSGPSVGWLLPRAGGISIQRGKLDRMALKTARDKFANGEQPMAVAPEGATNGLNEVVSPLEPGVAQLAFWCLEDLRASQRQEKVYILPLGMQYRYIDPPWEGIDGVLTLLESECGLTAGHAGDRYSRLTRIGGHLLSILEDYYRRFYQQEMGDAAADLAERLIQLREGALRTAESFFAIQAKGSMTDRCRRIEAAGWDRIYREDLKGSTLTPVQRGLADRAAEEADRRMWHMRIIESLVAVSGSYVRESPSADRFAEVTNLLYTTVQRLKGMPDTPPPSLGKQTIYLDVAEPILVDDLHPAYAANRQGARQAVNDLTTKLQETLDAMACPSSTTGSAGPPGP